MTVDSILKEKLIQGADPRILQKELKPIFRHFSRPECNQDDEHLIRSFVRNVGDGVTTIYSKRFALFKILDDERVRPFLQRDDPSLQRLVTAHMVTLFLDESTLQSMSFSQRKKKLKMMHHTADRFVTNNWESTKAVVQSGRLHSPPLQKWMDILHEDCYRLPNLSTLRGPYCRDDALRSYVANWLHREVQIATVCGEFRNFCFEAGKRFIPGIPSIRTIPNVANIRTVILTARGDVAQLNPAMISLILNDRRVDSRALKISRKMAAVEHSVRGLGSRDFQLACFQYKSTDFGYCLKAVDSLQRANAFLVVRIQGTEEGIHLATYLVTRESLWNQFAGEADAGDCSVVAVNQNK